jgi:DNA-binding NarL/FixJ family response regulator
MNDTFFCDLRMLIVEDQHPTASDLRIELEKAFPRVSIDCASTISEATECLRQARDAAVRYDAAILDFRLPRERIGGEEVADFSLRSEILGLSRETIIIHMSAHSGDPDIERFRQMRDATTEDYPAFIAKEADRDWSMELIAALKTGLCTREFRSRLGALFRREETETPPSSARSEPPPPRSDAARSFALSEFYVDAGRNWAFLSEPLRKELKAAFGFEMIGGKPCLGIMSLSEKPVTDGVEGGVM